MQFLTPADCGALVAKLGMGIDDLQAERPMHRFKHTATFVYQSPLANTDAISAHLVEYFGRFDWSMLWAYDLPWGDRSLETAAPEDWRRLGQWRLAANETRPLREAPGLIFDPDERSMLATAIGFAIHLGWDAVLVGRPLRSVVTFSHDDIIVVRARHNLAALTKGLEALGLKRVALQA